jgi:predicted phosphate transport protein (TIGR00153 family)
MRLFSALMPRETRFFALFNHHAEFVVQGGRLVADLMHEVGDERRRADLIRRIGEAERGADKVTHDTVSLLHSTFITPFDRYDIHRLISNMDDILDLIQDTAEAVHLYDLRHLPPEAPRLVRLLEASCERVQAAVLLLPSMDNAAKMLAIAQEIDSLESEADEAMRTGISRLFREEQDVRQLIMHKNVYEYLEEATDKCQDVANVIESVVIENV